jgi:hypothetical protein
MIGPTVYSELRLAFRSPGQLGTVWRSLCPDLWVSLESLLLRLDIPLTKLRRVQLQFPRR